MSVNVTTGVHYYLYYLASAILPCPCLPSNAANPRKIRRCTRFWSGGAVRTGYSGLGFAKGWQERMVVVVVVVVVQAWEVAAVHVQRRCDDNVRWSRSQLMLA